MKPLFVLLIGFIIESSFSSILYRTIRSCHIRTIKLYGHGFCNANVTISRYGPTFVASNGLNEKTSRINFYGGFIVLTAPNDLAQYEELRVLQRESLIYKRVGSEHAEKCLIFQAPLVLEYSTDRPTSSKNEIKVNQIWNHCTKPCKRFSLHNCTSVGYEPIDKYYYPINAVIDMDFMNEHTDLNSFAGKVIDSESKREGRTVAKSEFTSEAIAGSKLSGGALAGIAIACIVTISVIVSGTIFAVKKNKLKAGQTTQPVAAVKDSVLKAENPYSTLSANEKLNHLAQVQF